MLKVLVCTVLGEQFCHISALKRGKDLCLHSRVPEDLGYINTVHDSRKHSDLVCLRTVDGVACTSAPEVSAADHNADLYTCINRCLDLSCNFLYRIFVKASLFRTCKGLSAEL